jgi:hypothetical protein
MDFQLRCNHLRCRGKLKDKAVVTTCSHIFCLACSDSSSLGAGDSAARSCPACGTILDKPFDVTVAILRPTDDYKMSILSGLSPTIIMECANSGMAFWAYQSSQEIYYQEHANKSLKQQLDVKNQELNGVKSIAQNEISKLEDSLQNASDKISKLSRTLAELEEGRKSLERDRNKFRASYEKLKQKALVPGIESAAEENAAFAAQGGSGDYGGMFQPRSRTGSEGSGGRHQSNEYFAAPNGNIRSVPQSASKFAWYRPLQLTRTLTLHRTSSCTTGSIRPSPTAALGICQPRIAHASELLAHGKHSSGYPVPSATGQQGATRGPALVLIARRRCLWYEWHQGRKTAQWLHESCRNEQRSACCWYGLPLKHGDVEDDPENIFVAQTTIICSALLFVILPTYRGRDM